MEIIAYAIVQPNTKTMLFLSADNGHARALRQLESLENPHARLVPLAEVGQAEARVCDHCHSPMPGATARKRFCRDICRVQASRGKK